MAVQRSIQEVSVNELSDLAWERGFPATVGKVRDLTIKRGIEISKFRGLQLWLVDEFPAEFRLPRKAAS